MELDRNSRRFQRKQAYKRASYQNYLLAVTAVLILCIGGLAIWASHGYYDDEGKSLRNAATDTKISEAPWESTEDCIDTRDKSLAIIASMKDAWQDLWWIMAVCAAWSVILLAVWLITFFAKSFRRN